MNVHISTCTGALLDCLEIRALVEAPPQHTQRPEFLDLKDGIWFKFSSLNVETG